MTDKQTQQPAAATKIQVDNADLFAAIINLARASAGYETREIEIPNHENGLPSKIIVAQRNGGEGGFVSLRPLIEAWRTHPARRTGTAHATTLDSFIALVNRHRDLNSAIFAETRMPKPALTAIIDYHRANLVDDGDGDVARNCGHRITYEFPLTDEFKAWIAGNGQAMAQDKFAAFLEEHAAELTVATDSERQTYEPLFKERFATPAELIDLSRQLEIRVGVRVKRTERPQNGERVIVFEDEHKTASGERVDIPGVFMLAAPAFVDGAAIRIPARLRYRVASGDVVWFYSLYRPEFWLRGQVRDGMFSAAEATGCPAYESAPET